MSLFTASLHLAETGRKLISQLQHVHDAMDLHRYSEYV